jgi:hypothetical protein
MPTDIIFTKGPVSYVLGDIITLNQRAEDSHVAKAGTKVELYMRHFDYGDEMVGLYSSSGIPGWGDLDGEVSTGKGWWINIDELRSMVESPIMDKRRNRISKDFEFNGRNLKGLEGVPLALIETGEMFIELDENVGGGSADGLGKRGHCVLVPRKYLQEIKLAKEN